MAGYTPRILFASTVFAEGATGPATYARYLWEAFRDDPELEFHLLVPGANEVHPRIHVYGEPARASAHHRRISKALGSIANDFDIVHSNNAHSIAGVSTSAQLFCQVNDYEVADSLRNFRASIGRKGLRKTATLLWRRHREQKRLQSADLAVANSAYVRDVVLGAYGLEPEKCVTVYKAADLEQFRRPADIGGDPWPRPSAGSRVIFVGSNWELKGLDLALSAIQLLLPDYPDLQLVVIGTGHGAGSGRIRRQYEFLESQAAVYFVGRLDAPDIARYMWHADIAMLPSREEALGVSVLEAMAAGLPVIGSDAGGISEILGDGAFGLQFASGSTKDLREALQKLLESGCLRSDYAARSLERVAMFSRKRMIESLKALYKQYSHLPGTHAPGMRTSDDR